MNIENIINLANESNIKFIYTGYNLIVDASKGSISQDFKNTLKSNKNELIAFIENYRNKLSNPIKEDAICELSADEQEFFEERAAIMEYDADMIRKEAEKQAFICLTEYRERKLIN